MTTQLDLRLRIAADGQGASQELRAVAEEVKRVSSATEQNNRVVSQREFSSRRLAAAMQQEQREARGIPDAIRQMAAAYEASSRAVAARDAASRRFLDGLRAEIRELSLGEAGMRRYQAAQLGVMASAQPLIAQLEALQAKQRAANDEASKGAQVSAGLESVLGGLGARIAAAFSVTAIAAFGRAVVLSGMELQKLRSGLSFATGSPEEGAASYGRLRGLVGELGLELDTTARAYMRLNAASQGTTLAGVQTERIFRAVASAATTLGLTSAETEGAFTAIGQMMSKGTVQAEELRGQLGERLPGAFQMAARAMGVTTAELGKMLEQGQVIAADFLPRFASELEKTFGASAQSAAHNARQELNRLSTAWTDFKQGIAEAGVLDTATGQFQRLTGAIDGMNEALRKSKDQNVASRLLATVRGAYQGTELDQARRELVDRTDELLLAERQMGVSPDAAIKSRVDRLREQVTSLRALVQVSDPSFFVNSFTVKPPAVDDNARLQALRESLKDATGKFRTPQERMQDEIGDLTKKFGGQGIDAELNKVIAQIRAYYAKQIKPEEDPLVKLRRELAGLSPDYEKDLQLLVQSAGGKEGIESGRGGKLSMEEYQSAVEALIKRQPFAKDLARAGQRDERKGDQGAVAEIQYVEDSLREYYAWKAQQDDLSAKMELDARQRVKVAEIEAIVDSRARAQAQFDYQRELEQQRIDLIADPQARAKVQEQFDQEIIARQKKLTEDLKPEYQKMVEGWTDATRSMRDAFESYVMSGIRAGESMFIRFAQTGKLQISNISDFLIQEAARVMYRQAIAPAVSQGLGSLGGFVASLFGGGRAEGGPISGGLIYEVNEKGAPEVATINGRNYLLPGGDGQVTPVGSAGGAGVAGGGVTVNVYEAPGTRATVQQRPGANGGMDIQVMIERIENAMGERIAQGQGLWGPVSGRLRNYGVGA